MSLLTQVHRERVGRRIRFARRAAGLSHDQLAAKVGTSRQHLIKLEKGKHMPTDTMIRAIATATDRQVDYFLAEGDDEEEPDPVADLFKALERYVDHKIAVRV